MRLAFLLYKYFPYGGLQRDALRIARACAARGHAVSFHVLAWEGPAAEFPVYTVQARGLTQAARNRALAHAAQRLRADGGVDRVVGFNKLPGLDVYYAADACYRTRSWASRALLTPRRRQFLAYEAAVFGPAADTLALCLTPAEAAAYAGAYGTPAHRLAVLPPMVPAPAPPEPTTRTALRAQLGVPGEAPVALFVGSNFACKGLDRAIAALAALPRRPGPAAAQLVVVGADRARPFQRLARQLHIGDRVHFLGARDDVPRLMQGADLLLHPARRETAGLVLLEALAAGLPVLATDACGYAPHVASSGGGRVLRAPYDHRITAAALAAMFAHPSRPQWAAAARAWARGAAAQDMPGCAAERIESHRRARA